MPRLCPGGIGYGDDTAIAQKKLKDLGLDNVQYGSVDKEDTVVLLVANWTVVRQEPKAGTKVGAEDLIVLTMTKR